MAFLLCQITLKTNIFSRILNYIFVRQMAMSTVLHHMCTAGALVLLLVSGIKQDGPCRGTVFVYRKGPRPTPSVQYQAGWTLAVQY